MKDCAFQYATADGEMYEDTGLITWEDALVLWEKHKPLFKQHMEQGEDPEMALWVNMRDEEDYHQKAKYWHWSDFEIRGDELWEVTKVL